MGNDISEHNLEAMKKIYNREALLADPHTISMMAQLFIDALQRDDKHLCLHAEDWGVLRTQLDASVKNLESILSQIQDIGNRITILETQRATAHTTLFALETLKLHIFFPETKQKPAFYIATPNVWDTYIENGSTVFNTDTWYHICCIRSGSNFYMYINGVSEGTGVSNSSNAIQNVNTGLYIGCSVFTGYPARYWNGQIDEILFINGYALSTSEISALYNSGTGAFLIS